MYMTLRSMIKTAGFLAATFCFSLSYASHFTLPPSREALIGQVQYASAESGDTTPSIAERYNLGVNAIVAANPGIRENMLIQAGAPIKISGQFLLPPLPRRGIVINLSEMRLYYYPEGSNEVMTFPIGIGRIGKTIPIRPTKVVRKTINPTWTPPQDIREFDEQLGIKVPRVVLAGPDNPLGPYAIYLGIPTYLIHSTIFPESIGNRSSFGCIRMHENDIKQFYSLMKPGIPVMIVDMPNKVAWEDTTLYLEAHPPLEERSHLSTLQNLVNTVQSKLPRNHVTLVNWQMVSYLSEEPDGVPHEIGVVVK